MNLKKILLAGILIAPLGYVFSQNVAINTTGVAANASAILDISSTNTGLLVPRVALTITTAAAPVAAPSLSLLVFNTATVADVTPGYYYWNGAIWVRMMNTGNDWLVSGNAGTNPAVNFAGTTDAVDFVIRTNNTEKMRATVTGRVGIGTSAPAYTLDLNTGTFGFGNSDVRTETRNDAGLQGNVGAQSGFFETSAPTNYPAGASSWWHLIDVRHSNPANNYALQISGSFFDQNLYFRKTNNNPAQAWTQILTTASLGCATTNYLPKMTSATTMGCSQVFDNGTNVGIGTVTPGYKLDVVGLGGGNIDIKTDGRIWTNSTSGGLWMSNLQDCFIGNISAAQLGIWTSTIGWNAFNINKVTGFTGIGTSAPASMLHVYGDGDNIPMIYGQNVNATAGTTSYGVRGECGSSGLGSAGVSGVSTNSGQNEIGVVGDYSLWGASIFGLAWASAYTDMPASRDFGVFGTVNYFTGTGVYGRNTNTTLGSAYGMYCNGNFAVTGAKAASIPTSKGNQLVYCMESPDVWFEDAGFGQLNGGSVHVQLDDIFTEAIFADDTHPFLIFTQEMGESQGLVVIPDADWKGFMVKEKNGGSSNIKFSYRIMAKRRFYEDVRFGVDANQPFVDNLKDAKHVDPATTDPQVMKAFVDEKTRLKEAEMKSQDKQK